MGKFLLFAAAAQQGFYAIVVFAALNSTVSLYYYLLLVKEAYIIKPLNQPKELVIDQTQRISLALLSGGIILLGLLPVFSSRIFYIVQ